MDNVLFSEDTGEFLAWIDWEDAAIGPLLFDLACGLIGCCYLEGSTLLDPDRLQAYLRGYSSVRHIQAAEAAALPSAMCVALLCNASWRFENFNIRHREIESCRTAHQELVERYNALLTTDEATKVSQALRQLPAACDLVND